MRVTSDLADLQFRLGAVRRDGDELVVESAPGSSLDACIRVDAAEARSLLGRLLGSGAVWAFLARLLFARRPSRRGGAGGQGAQSGRDNPRWRARRERIGLNKPW